MPESKTRKQAVDKKKSKEKAELAEKRREAKRLAPASRNWVPAVFVPMGLLGVLWMVVWQLAGQQIGFMRAMGDWNVLVGLVLIVASFSLMTLWK